MHTFIGKYGTRIFHNGDYSGVAKIIDDNDKEFKIEIEELLDFVAEYVRSTMIERIEQAETEELLTGTFPISAKLSREKS